MDARLLKALIALAAAAVLSGCVSTVSMEIEYDRALYEGYGGKLVVEPVLDPPQPESELVCASFDDAAKKAQESRGDSKEFQNLDARVWETSQTIIVKMIFQVPRGTKEAYITLLANKKREDYFSQLRIPLTFDRTLKVEIGANGNIRLGSR